MNNLNYCLNCNKWNAEIFRFTGKRFCSRGCEIVYGQGMATEAENLTIENLKNIIGIK